MERRMTKTWVEQNLWGEGSAQEEQEPCSLRQQRWGQGGEIDETYYKVLWGHGWHWDGIKLELYHQNDDDAEATRSSTTAETYAKETNGRDFGSRWRCERWARGASRRWWWWVPRLWHGGPTSSDDWGEHRGGRDWEHTTRAGGTWGREKWKEHDTIPRLWGRRGREPKEVWRRFLGEWGDQKEEKCQWACGWAFCWGGQRCFLGDHRDGANSTSLQTKDQLLLPQWGTKHFADRCLTTWKDPQNLLEVHWNRGFGWSGRHLEDHGRHPSGAWQRMDWINWVRHCSFGWESSRPEAQVGRWDQEDHDKRAEETFGQGGWDHWGKGQGHVEHFAESEAFVPERMESFAGDLCWMCCDDDGVSSQRLWVLQAPGHPDRMECLQCTRQEVRWGFDWPGAALPVELWVPMWTLEPLATNVQRPGRGLREAPSLDSSLCMDEEGDQEASSTRRTFAAWESMAKWGLVDWGDPTDPQFGDDQQQDRHVPLWTTWQRIQALAQEEHLHRHGLWWHFRDPRWMCLSWTPSAWAIGRKEQIRLEVPSSSSIHAQVLQCNFGRCSERPSWADVLCLSHRGADWGARGCRGTSNFGWDRHDGGPEFESKEQSLDWENGEPWGRHGAAG